MSDSKIAAYLAEHPKMTGVLFTMMMILSQAGTVIATNGNGSPGP
ncbi:DUF7503 family protein [Halorarius halobius]|nr:hypothetical protein [Halorarius halobius]